jgi:hypothetical protein
MVVTVMASDVAVEDSRFRRPGKTWLSQRLRRRYSALWFTTSQ